jgi:hypothetical protein
MKKLDYAKEMERIFKKENVFKLDRNRFMIVFSGEVYMFIKIGKLKDDDILKILSKKHFALVECWHYRKMGDRIIKDVEKLGRFT